MAKIRIDFIAKSNSVSGKKYDIDIAEYDALIATLSKSNAVFASVYALKAQMISNATNHLNPGGKYSDVAYDASVQFSVDQYVQKLQQITTSDNSVLCQVYGIKL